MLDRAIHVHRKLEERTTSLLYVLALHRDTLSDHARLSKNKLRSRAFREGRRERKRSCKKWGSVGWQVGKGGAECFSDSLYSSIYKYTKKGKSLCIRIAPFHPAQKVCKFLFTLPRTTLFCGVIYESGVLVVRHTEISDDQASPRHESFLSELIVKLYLALRDFVISRGGSLMLFQDSKLGQRRVRSLDLFSAISACTYYETATRIYIWLEIKSFSYFHAYVHIFKIVLFSIFFIAVKSWRYWSLHRRCNKTENMFFIHYFDN